MSAELLEDLAVFVSEQLASKGISKEAADTIGASTADAIRDHWGGQQVYIPMAESDRTQARDLELQQKFNGNNHAKLAREYGISLQHVYRVLKRVARSPRKT